MADYNDHHNAVRLHSVIWLIITAEKLTDREKKIFKARDQKLDAVRQLRAVKIRQDITAQESIALP